MDRRSSTRDAAEPSLRSLRSPALLRWAQVELERPGGWVLFGEVERFGRDRLWTEAPGLWVVARSARVVDGAVDDEQGDVNAFGRQLPGERLGEAALRGLGGSKGGRLRATPERGGGADHDDPAVPLAAHVGQHALNAGEQAERVDSEGLLELRRRELVRALPHAGAGVVDEDCGSALLGADGIIAASLDYETIGSRSAMLMVTALGTAVRLRKK